MLVAQISDPHLVAQGSLLYDQIDANTAFERCLKRLLSFSPHPDVLVITGDLVNDAQFEVYELLARKLEPLPFPVHLLPGNHDSPENLRRAFPGQPFAPANLCCQKAAYRGRTLLLLDVQLEGQPWGEIGDAQIAWLDSAVGDEPTLLFMHHPPFKTGIAGMDEMNCRNEKLLANWLLQHPNVVGVYCGHVHRFIATTFAGRVAVCSPAPAHQIALDLSGIRDNLACSLEPGGFLLHHWVGSGAPVSHLLPIDDYPSYYVYR